jgi:thymidylate synthase (FAD)
MMKVERLDNSVDDLAVVNAARVSFGKQKDVLDDSDDKLIKYLAEHNHWTPFGHPIFCFRHEFDNDDDALEYVLSNQNPGTKFHGHAGYLYESSSLYSIVNRPIVLLEMLAAANHENDCVMSVRHLLNANTNLIKGMTVDWEIKYVTGEDTPAPLRWARFRLKMPIFVAREWFRHTKGFVRNEISRRYVDDTPDCWLPSSYRSRHSSKKQGSTNEAPEKNEELIKSAKMMTDMTVEFYKTLLKNDVAPEMARHILPQSMYTEFIETAYIEDYERLLILRLQPDAQAEIREVAAMLEKELHNA